MPVEVDVRIVAQNLVHLAVVERGVQAAGQTLGPPAGAAARQLRDGAERPIRLEPRRTAPNAETRRSAAGTRRCARGEVGGVAAAVGLERRAGSQQADPLEVRRRQDRRRR